MLTDNEFIRYSRQIALDEISDQGQVSLKKAHVLIIGCGGLGNLDAMYLAGAGIGTLVIADGDVIDLSNLQRQIAFSNQDIGFSKANVLKEKITSLNNECKVRSINKVLTGTQLDLEVMLADMVIDCTDNFKTRYEINRSCRATHTPLVSGTATNWNGQVCLYSHEVGEPCYECLYPEDSTTMQANCQTLGVLGPIVGMIASFQALLAIRYLVNVDDRNEAQNKLHVFNGLTLKWQAFQMTKSEQCNTCGLTKNNVNSEE